MPTWEAVTEGVMLRRYRVEPLGGLVSYCAQDLTRFDHDREAQLQLPSQAHAPVQIVHRVMLK